jgi:hypothetical protein
VCVSVHSDQRSGPPRGARLAFQWRGRHYSADSSDDGFAATDTEGAVAVTIKVSHPDQADVLHEALDDFIAKCDHKKHWRAIAAAEDLKAQLTENAQPA